MNNIQILSGSDVSGSCYLAEVNGMRILFDCGIKPSSEYAQRIEIPEPDTIDIIFISHAHLDHMGNIAYVASVCKNAEIFVTSTTADFIYYQLSSTVAGYIGANTDALRYHNELLCRLVMNRIHVVGFNTKEQYVNKAGLTCRFTFFRAGHMPGAAMIYISVNKYRILYTGDFSARETPLTEGYALDKISVDTMILCGLHANEPDYELRADSVQAYYEKKIKQAFIGSAKVVIPSTQLTKGLEILSVIDSMITEKIIQKIPVYITDSLWQLSKSYERKNELFRLPDYFKNLADRPPQTDLYDREIIIGDRGQAKKLFPKYSEVRTDFSLHSDYSDLVTIIRKIKPAEVFVVHVGNTALHPQLMFDSRLCGVSEIYYPQEQQTYELQGRKK